MKEEINIERIRELLTAIQEVQSELEAHLSMVFREYSKSIDLDGGVSETYRGVDFTGVDRSNVYFNYTNGGGEDDSGSLPLHLVVADESQRGQMLEKLAAEAQSEREARNAKAEADRIARDKAEYMRLKSQFEQST